MKGILELMITNLQKRPLPFICAILLLTLGYEERQRALDKKNCDIQKQQLINQLDSTIYLFINKQQQDNSLLQNQNNENIRIIEFLKDRSRK